MVTHSAFWDAYDAVDTALAFGATLLICWWAFYSLRRGRNRKIALRCLGVTLVYSVVQIGWQIHTRDLFIFWTVPVTIFLARVWWKVYKSDDDDDDDPKKKPYRLRRKVNFRKFAPSPIRLPRVAPSPA
jgi:hypothetical protein